MTKAKAQTRHAKRRAMERYGITMNTESLVRQIQTGQDAIFVWKQSRRVSHWDVVYKGEMLRVVYDKERQTVITVLPKEARDEPHLVYE